MLTEKIYARRIGHSSPRFPARMFTTIEETLTHSGFEIGETILHVDEEIS